MTQTIFPAYERLVDNETPLYDELPASWRVDYEKFSAEKRLYDFQQEALKHGLRLLHQFVMHLSEYDEYTAAKRALFDDLDRYTAGYASDPDLRLQKKRTASSKGIDAETFNHHLRERYPISERSRYGNTYEEVDFEHLANRMGFWMATGSGKTVLAVKFVEVLHILMERGCIPDRDILLLTYQDEILRQFKTEIDEYNEVHDTQIETWSVDEYADVKRGGKIGTRGKINIFTYRSDNISDETKEKKISFEDFENDGEWYVLLDEAHKGRASQSTRQAYYSILSRNGFLFNFSATFTDPSDIVTTVYNFNIKEFTEAGYGKNVYISDSDIHSITEEDVDEDEKRKTVLKSLIALTMQKQAAGAVDFPYHDPLLTAFMNSVNTEDSDLELFFQEIEAIANEDRPQLFEEAKRELHEDLNARETYAFSDDLVAWRDVHSLSKTDVLQSVFHSRTHADIEVQHSPESSKELVFSLKTSPKPFALMKIGRKSTWLEEKLADHEVEEEMDYQSYFQNLNYSDSTINLLLGSRSFYEGWDSNRPNVMLFINLGKSDKRKFILQAIGRGMRIEPEPNERTRLQVPPRDSDATQEDIRVLETLLVFGTSAESLNKIVQTIQEINNASYHDVGGFERIEDDPEKELLVPKYMERGITHATELPPFSTSKKSVKRVWNWFGDDRVLYTQLSNLDYESLSLMRQFLEQGQFRENHITDINILQDFHQHVNSKRYKSDGFESVDHHIDHFENIRANFEEEQDKAELEAIIEKVRDADKQTVDEEDLVEMIREGQIEKEEAITLMESVGTEQSSEVCEKYGVTIQQIHKHFYSPVLYLESGDESRFQNIIDVKSEVGFLKKVLEYDENTGLFAEADWWKFSKLSERTDDVYIPYGGDKKFYPDFVFWVANEGDYYIVFVDPKSTAFAEPTRKKIRGYEEIFTSTEGPIEFEHNCSVGPLDGTATTTLSR